MSGCTFESCGNPVRNKMRGLCNRHYHLWRRYGTPAGRPSAVERFWMRVDKNAPGGCWEWTGLVNNGYGRVSWGERMQYTHRIAYALTNGPVPAGLDIDHKCHNTICANPAHLRLATRSENAQHTRGANRNSKTGVQGVYYVEANGYYQCQGAVDGKWTHLAYFKSLPEAEEFMRQWRKENYPFSKEAASL